MGSRRFFETGISDICGGDAFLPVLYLMACLLSSEAVLPRAYDTHIYLTALGMLLTAVLPLRAHLYSGVQ